MPRAYCPRCDTAYHVTTITDNGPVCGYCMAHGEIVVLLPSVARRFSRATISIAHLSHDARSAGARTDRE